MAFTISNSLPFTHTHTHVHVSKHKMIHIDCETMNVCLECMHVCIFCMTLFIPPKNENEKKSLPFADEKFALILNITLSYNFPYLHMCFVFHSAFYIYYAICHVHFLLAQHPPHNCCKCLKKTMKMRTKTGRIHFIFI